MRRIGVLALLPLLALSRAVGADDPAPPADAKVTLAKVEPRQKEDGTWLRMEGTTRFADDVMLLCEVRFFGRELPGGTCFARVKKGRFAATLGPLPGKLLPGVYQAGVRFLMQYQNPEVFYSVQDEEDAYWSLDMKVGGEEEIAAFEKGYREAVSKLIAAIDARDREVAAAYEAATQKKKWQKDGKLDAEAALAWTRECEAGYRKDIEALQPYANGAVPYRPDFADRLVASADAFHVILCMYVKPLFTEAGVAVPSEFQEMRMDLPPSVLEKQYLGEALQPVRDWLAPPKEEGEAPREGEPTEAKDK